MQSGGQEEWGVMDVWSMFVSGDVLYDGTVVIDERTKRGLLDGMLSPGGFETFMVAARREDGVFVPLVNGDIMITIVDFLMGRTSTGDGYVVRREEYDPERVLEEMGFPFNGNKSVVQSLRHSTSWRCAGESIPADAFARFLTGQVHVSVLPSRFRHAGNRMALDFGACRWNLTKVPGAFWSDCEDISRDVRLLFPGMSVSDSRDVAFTTYLLSSETSLDRLDDETKVRLLAGGDVRSCGGSHPLSLIVKRWASRRRLDLGAGLPSPTPNRCAALLAHLCAWYSGGEYDTQKVAVRVGGVFGGEEEYLARRCGKKTRAEWREALSSDDPVLMVGWMARNAGRWHLDPSLRA